MENLTFQVDARRPLVLTVPGLNNSGPDHWQSEWERTRGDCVRVDLGSWATPTRNGWVTRLDAAIRQATVDHGGPIILAAHSLGCLAVAWWGALQSQPYGWPVAGALLVAPADCDRADAAPSISGFAPAPRVNLPFPSILVASRDDPFVSFDRAHSLGKYWGSEIVDAGVAGHVNADSGLGDWPSGQRLLDRLIDLGEDQLTLSKQARPAVLHAATHGQKPEASIAL